jgi:DNA-binding MarR family transcriptional regulator
MNESKYTSDLSDDEKVLMAIVRAAEIFKRNHSSVFRDYGLSFAQYNVLRVLDASAGGQNRMSEISRIMLVAGANLTGIAKRLQAEGFILKRPDPTDERVTILEITPKGKRTLKHIERPKDDWVEIMLADIPKSERLDLLKKLKLIIRNGRKAD